MNPRILSVAAILAALAMTPFLSAQNTTPTAVLPSTGSQANSPGAYLELVCTVQAPGALPSGPHIVLAPTSESTTLAYTCWGASTYPTAGFLAMTGAIFGAPNSPFILALAIEPGSNMCGGFAGWPCMTGPSLFSSAGTPWGTYHLNANPILIVDSIFGTAYQLVIGSNGAFPFAGSLLVDTNTNGGVEMRFAMQAMIVDPTAPSGYSLTACATIDQWVQYP